LINSPRIIRSDKKGNVFVATNSYEDKFAKKLYMISGSVVSELYRFEGFGEIKDFYINEQGDIYLIRDVQNDNSIEFYSKFERIDAKTNELKTLISYEMYEGRWKDLRFDGLSSNDEGEFYLSSEDKGVIYVWDESKKTPKILAGEAGQNHFIDAINIVDNDQERPYTSFRFFHPTKMVYTKNKLYVIDNNLIRQITVKDGLAKSVETVAGCFVTNGNAKNTLFEGMGKDVSFFDLSDISQHKGTVLLCSNSTRGRFSCVFEVGKQWESSLVPSKP
jgi:hypothetical protein